jgi:hypothetical protein
LAEGYDNDNYRGITLTSNVYKVYSKVLEENIMAFLEDNNILGESQWAFRRERRIFPLNGICALRKSSKLKTCIAFLDSSMERGSVLLSLEKWCSLK